MRERNSSGFGRSSERIPRDSWIAGNSVVGERNSSIRERNSSAFEGSSEFIPRNSRIAGNSVMGERNSTAHRRSSAIVALNSTHHPLHL